MMMLSRSPSTHYYVLLTLDFILLNRWDKAQTIDSLIRKAGYSGVIDEKFLESIRCRRYKSSKCRVSYQEYVVKVGSDPLLCNVTSDNKRWCVSM